MCYTISDGKRRDRMKRRWLLLCCAVCLMLAGCAADSLRPYTPKKVKPLRMLLLLLPNRETKNILAYRMLLIWKAAAPLISVLSWIACRKLTITRNNFVFRIPFLAQPLNLSANGTGSASPVFYAKFIGKEIL